MATTTFDVGPHRFVPNFRTPGPSIRCDNCNGYEDDPEAQHIWEDDKPITCTALHLVEALAEPKGFRVPQRCTRPAGEDDSGEILRNDRGEPRCEEDLERES